MAKKRLTMRKIRDILRLRHEVKLSYRDISQALVNAGANPKLFAAALYPT